MSRRWIALLAALAALTVGAPALAQAPAAVQEALFSYLTNIAPDFNSISVQAVKSRLDAGEKVFVLDVREENEFAAGHIPGAVNIPIRTVPRNMDKLPPKDAPIVVVCRSGMRAAYVTMTLGILGYSNVKDMAFGMSEWEKQGYPMVK
ncbi:MAG TPA: rhodanese-like domain-containing protein [bacterium]|nr:rhodanese-like domain-containing protein [bacterium]